MKAFTKLIAVLLAAVMCLCVFSACAVKTDPPLKNRPQRQTPQRPQMLLLSRLRLPPTSRSRSRLTGQTTTLQLSRR